MSILFHLLLGLICFALAYLFFRASRQRTSLSFDEPRYTLAESQRLRTRWAAWMLLFLGSFCLFLLLFDKW